MLFNYKSGVLLCFVLLTSIFACESKPKEVLQYYPSGELSRKHFEIKSKKEGKMTDYYKDGKVKGERLFENDVQVGKTVYFYPSGSVKEVLYFDAGKMNGGDSIFYEDGKLQFLRNWNMGVLDGYIRKLDTAGIVTYEAKYANDQLIQVQGKSVHPDSLITK